MSFLSFDTQSSKPKNKGFIRAHLANGVPGLPLSFVAYGALNKMKEISKISHDDSVELVRAAQKGLKQTGLYEKGVRAYKIKANPMTVEFKNSIIRDYLDLFNKEKCDKALESLKQKAKQILTYDRKDTKALLAIREEILSNKKNAKLANKNLKIGNFDIVETMTKAQALMFKEGANACYLSKANKIITPKGALETSIFHEMGHALNANGSAILKTLQKLHGTSSFFPPLILMVSLLNKRKTTDEVSKDDSKIQKGKDFIKRNAPKLTALAFVPMLSEEAIASIRGQKVAKGLVNNNNLSKDLFKKIKIGNLCGFSTYAILALSSVLGVKFAIKVKDSIQAKYEEKRAQKG